MKRILNLHISRTGLDLFQRVVIHRSREEFGDGGFFSMEELDKMYGLLLYSLTLSRDLEIAQAAKALGDALENQPDDGSWRQAEGKLLNLTQPLTQPATGERKWNR